MKLFVEEFLPPVVGKREEKKRKRGRSLCALEELFYRIYSQLTTVLSPTGGLANS